MILCEKCGKKLTKKEETKIDNKKENNLSNRYISLEDLYEILDYLQTKYCSNGFKKSDDSTTSK